MATRMLKIAMGLVLLVLLNACPGVDCTDSIDAYPTGLVKIEPLQSSYQLGDEITYNIIIPSTNDYFGRSLDLYNETGVQSTILGGSDIDKLKSNIIEVIDGEHKQINNYLTANLVYYQSENEYRYKIIVKLTSAGNYKLYAKNLEVHFLKRNDKECLNYNLYTSIDGITGEFFEFDVVP